MDLSALRLLIAQAREDAQGIRESDWDDLGGTESALRIANNAQRAPALARALEAALEVVEAAEAVRHRHVCYSYWDDADYLDRGAALPALEDAVSRFRAALGP